MGSPGAPFGYKLGSTKGLSFAHFGPDAPWQIKFKYEIMTVTSCVESISVVDTLDVTRNLDVSLDCACSAEIVYYNTKLDATT